MRTIVWYRGKDLRVADHAPLTEAAEAGEVIPLFVLDPYFFAPERACALPNRIQFLLASLRSLEANLAAKGSKLVVVAGKSVEVVPRLAREWSADRVVAHRWVEPFARERDERVKAALGDRFELYEGETLLRPGTLRTGAGKPYSVFSQFARAFEKTACVEAPLPAPKRLPPLPDNVRADTVPIPALSDLGLVENPGILPGGERAAHERLTRYLAKAAGRYADDRNRMDLEGTSRLSTDLKFGTLSARQLWQRVSREVEDARSQRAFLNELVWREFAHSTLWDRPELLREPFQPKWRGFPWREEEHGWRAWLEGKTGYPVVDAAARQLLAEGFVHNRARMIAASFLTKHLLIDFRRGEAHYMAHLTDGDWAQNDAGWQWSAGCGCDAQPYFRIFNPVSQGETFDPEGDYVRRWVPELARVPAKFIHEPWGAPPEVLQAAGVRLGATYPRPVVDHKLARERFLTVAKAHLGSASSAATDASRQRTAR
ncbi:MAG: deoxyribodipyrimidine photo-lyase [Deltaproteobacteria bacterium]|nr:deoxyribodipyrimidine photo-lyase [Deltaproteobacteria bacterium]